MTEPGTRTRGKPTSARTIPAVAGCVKRHEQNRGEGGRRAEQTGSSAPAIQAPDRRWGDRQRGVRRTTRGAGQPPGPGWIGRCTEARHSGGEAQVAGDLPEHRRAFDDDNNLQHATVVGSHEGIHLIEWADCCLR